MQFGFQELVNEADTPSLIRWIKQINERPATKRMFEEVPMERLSPKPAEASAYCRHCNRPRQAPSSRWIRLPGTFTDEPNPA